MKNVKRMVAAGTMMVAMVCGTTLANAGIIIAGKEETKETTCGTTDLEGIIIAGIIIAKTGIIIAGRKRGETQCSGIIIAG
jgi:hypothetical protein